MKKLLVTTAAIIAFGSSVNAAEMIGENSLTNPLFIPKKDKLHSETKAEFVKKEFTQYTPSTNTEISLETENNTFEQQFKFGVKDNLTTSFTIGYEMEETEETYNNSTPDTSYDSRGWQNPTLGFEYRFLNTTQKLDLLGSAQFDVFPRYDTQNEGSDGTIASGRNEFGLGIRYGKMWEKFTLATIISGKYLGNAKYNEVNGDRSKDSLLDKKHYLFDVKIQSEYMFNDMWSMNFNLGYVHEQNRDILDKTAATVTKRDDGDKMSTALQFNYMLNHILTLSAYYEAEWQKDTSFDVIDSSTDDYEYRDQMRQTAGLKASMEY
jgi:hypothetical protein